MTPLTLLLILAPAPPGEPAVIPARERLAALRSRITGNPKLPPRIKELLADRCLPMLTNPVLVKAVLDQNRMKVPLSKIREVDRAWIDAEEELPIMRETLHGRCGQELMGLQRANPRIGEMFVMDDQGALVGMSNLTTDYWQGDEPKWTGSYDHGKGGIDVGEPKYDRSAKSVLQQVSLPIIDADGKVIGAITFGLQVESPR